MSAHTPGPWTEDDGFISGPFNKAVAELPSYSGTEGNAYFSEQDANANLICAAPDLLKACAAAIAGYPGWNKMIHAAYAKATGTVHD